MESKDNFQFENDYENATDIMNRTNSRKSEINEAADVFSDNNEDESRLESKKDFEYTLQVTKTDSDVSRKVKSTKKSVEFLIDKPLRVNKSKEDADSSDDDEEKITKQVNSDDENENSDEERDTKIIQLQPKFEDDNILEFYEYLRSQHDSKNPWEDPEFAADENLFGKDGVLPDRYIENNIEIQFDRMNIDTEDIKFFDCDQSHNINYDFKIKRGILYDRAFLGSILMLFRKKEEFFTNLVVDYDNVDKNIRAGFCGFTFFINGEWKNITIDTRLPFHQTEDMSLSTANSNKNSIWLSLLTKAYAKLFKTYDVLNYGSIKNTLVELTGGISKKIEIKEKLDDSGKKLLFEEIKRCIAQKYLVGCLKFDEHEEDLNESRDDQLDDEDIISNSMYSILDLQEVDGYRLIFLVNHWNRGKSTFNFGPEDDIWETNKSLKEKLNYEIHLTDGTFWISFEDWLTRFNQIYYCRIFPDSWSQYCIPGAWSGMSSGGAPPKNLEGVWVPERYIEEKQQPQQPPLTIGGLSAAYGKTLNISIITKESSASPFGKDASVASAKKSVFNPTPNPDYLKGTTLAPVDESSEPGVSHFKFNIPEVNNKKPSAVQLSNVTAFKESAASFNKINQSGISNNNPNNLIPGKLLDKISENPKSKKNKEVIKRLIVNDTEDRWFLNPQYKLEINKGLKVIVSLMQEDERLTKKPYQKYNMMILASKGKYSRVWDIKEDELIKKVVEGDQSEVQREISLTLDYNEISKKISQKKRKKLINKHQKIYVNIIPYLEYNKKYEIEKIMNTRSFKLIKEDCIFWLRIFSSDEIYLSELPVPFERYIDNAWTDSTAGGARYIKDQVKTCLVENPTWPLNPQYLIKFEQNVSMKIILRKLQGRVAHEDTKIGMILTKPQIEDLSSNTKTLQKTRKTTEYNKFDQMQKVLDSTNKILQQKQMDLEKIKRKLSINTSEWVVESSYSNQFCASLFMNFNKIDSPIMLVPTLELPEANFGYKLSVYSNKPVELISLNSDECKVIHADWKESNSGGCHLVDDNKRIRKEEDNFNKRLLTYEDNPKFIISFDSKERIPEIKFEIVLCRSESIWKKKISNSIINTMMGVYVFKYEKDRWRDYCLNSEKIEFVPKNEIKLEFNDVKVDPKGYIIMPATYGPNINGPFVMMVKCKEKFSIVPFDPKKD